MADFRALRRAQLGRIVLFCAMFLSAIAVPAHAQEDPIEWSVGSLSEVVAGRWNKLAVHAKLDPKWHLYGPRQPRPPIALEINIYPDDRVTTRTVEQPKPIRRYDEAFGIETEFFEKTATFLVPFSVAGTATTGVQEFEVHVKYQVCTERVCLPPATEILPISLTVSAPPAGESDSAAATVPAVQENANPAAPVVAPPVAGSSAAVDAAARSSTTTPTSYAAETSSTLWKFLLLAMIMGAFALTTPCVFPMIPLTVSYFSRGEAAAVTTPRSTHVKNALLYGAGIVMAFTLLGLLLAVLYGATGLNQFAANPWINLLVAALFISFALDLLGVIEFRLPWQISTRLNRISDRSGLTGILLMGVAFAVTTFTCTVPFFGTLLVAAAAGEWLRPVTGMIAFSTVFALPFVVLALFPAALRSFPKSGSWMGSLKTVLGLVEIGAALKFLSNADLVWQLGLLPRAVVLSAWIALSLLAAVFLLGLLRLPGVGTPSIGVGRALSGGAFVAIALFLTPGLFGRSVGEFEAFLPPRAYPSSESAILGVTRGNEGGVWLTSYSAAQSEAQATGKPIFVDFTGYTCTNCRWMEAHVFPRPHIQQRLSQYVLVRLYTDGQGAEYAANQEMQRKRFGTVALPFYAVLTSTGETVATFPGLTRKSEEFALFLDEGLAAQPLQAAGL